MTNPLDYYIIILTNKTGKQKGVNGMNFSYDEQEKMILEMNEKLKTIKKFGDLKAIEKEYGLKIGYILQTKKNNRCKTSRPLNGKWAKCARLGMDVSDEKINNDTRMTYIVDGDDRVRECLVANLWRYVEFIK